MYILNIELTKDNQDLELNYFLYENNLIDEKAFLATQYIQKAFRKQKFNGKIDYKPRIQGGNYLKSELSLINIVDSCKDWETLIYSFNYNEIAFIEKYIACVYETKRLLQEKNINIIINQVVYYIYKILIRIKNKINISLNKQDLDYIFKIFILFDGKEKISNILNISIRTINNFLQSKNSLNSNNFNKLLKYYNIS